MRIINVTPKMDALLLGKQGENKSTKFLFDVSGWLEDYPGCSIGLNYRPAKSDVSYPCILTDENYGKKGWLITSSELVNDGDGQAELVCILDEVIEKDKRTWKTKVNKSLGGSGTAPDPWENWEDTFIELAERAEDAAEDAEEAAAAAEEFATHGPIIDDNGNWNTWDTETQQYVDTEVPAQGPEGDPGTDATPDLITSDYSDLTFPVAEGKLCYHSGLLYKANQAIATSEEWNAAHWTQTTIEAEYLSLLTEINSKADEPTGTKSAGKVYGLDSNLNPAWVDGGGGSVDPQDIQQAVDDWLDENITNPDSPPLDRSLSSSSSAAPADMLGDVDAELEMQTINVDLLANATHTAGRKIDADGYIQSVSTYDIYEFDYDGSYDKFDAVLYSSSNYQLRAMTFHNENGVPLETDQFINTSGDYKSEFTDKTIPAGTKKIYLSYRNSMGPISASYKKNVSKRLSDIESDIDTISVFPVSSKNLCDESKKVVGLIYEASGALIDTYTSHRATDYIEISPSTIYTISAYNKNTGAFDIEGLRYAFYKSDKTFISGAKPERKYSTFRTPSNAKYVRFSMLQTNVEKWQFERRSFATKYVPYNTIIFNDESDEMFLNFPAKTFAVTGLEYNLYLFNVRPEKSENEFLSRYYIPTFTKIARYGRFLRLKGDNTSTDERVIGAEAKSLTKYGYKLFSINVKDPANLSAASVLILGDSTTANGYVVQNLYEMGGENHLITPLGTQGTAPYNHEGRSGWRLYDYFNTSENNPFYNPSTETFDAAYYFTNSGVLQPDVFIINLGINDMHYNSGTLYDAKTHAAEYIDMVNAVIESVKGVSPSIKVAICLTTPPNTDPYSFGSAGTNIIDYDAYRISNLVLCDALIDAYDYRESEGIYLIPINACLDTKYNMPTTTEHPNSRSDLNITVPNNAANVHPNTAGYHQIADEMYAFICSLYVT